MNKDYGFIEGFIREKNKIIVVISSEKLEGKNIAHAFIGYWKGGSWEIWDEGFSVIKVCVVEGLDGPTLIEMGMEGEIMIADSHGFKEEKINTTEEAPNRLRGLNDIRLIGNNVYVTGMRRQIFRRNNTKKIWERFDSGVFVSKKTKEIAGFLSIDGFSDSEIYAVGYRGQIWRYNGFAWEQIASPTNIRLESVRCVKNEFVVVVGDQGLILKGRGDIWEVVEHDVTDETLTDVEVAQDSIYISTEVGSIYQLVGSELIKINTRIAKEITTGNLHSNGHILLSVGERDLLIFDGNLWEELPHPSLPSV